MIKEYEINEETLAVISISEKKAKVLEQNKEYLVEKSAYEIMDDSCKYFGSSYEGRVSGAKSMLEANYKLPVIVEESRKMIFFPTESPLLPKCMWISLKHYDHMVNDDTCTKIYFKNGTVINTNISKASLNNQVLRSTRLESILNYRRNG